MPASPCISNGLVHVEIGRSADIVCRLIIVERRLQIGELRTEQSQGIEGGEILCVRRDPLYRECEQEEISGNGSSSPCLAHGHVPSDSRRTT